MRFDCTWRQKGSFPLITSVVLLLSVGLFLGSCASKPASRSDVDAGQLATAEAAPEAPVPETPANAQPSQADTSLMPAPDVGFSEEPLVAESEQPVSPPAETDTSLLFPPLPDASAIAALPPPPVEPIIIPMPPQKPAAIQAQPELVPVPAPKVPTTPKPAAPKPEPPKPATPKPETPKPLSPEAPSDFKPEIQVVPMLVDSLPELPARTAPRIVDEEIAFSRNARATVGQLVEVPFRGAGWVFLGEMGSRKGLPYDSRRLDTDGQTFIFRAETAGTYSLKFFKQDFIADTIVNDFVQITVVDNPVTASVGGFSLPIDRGRVVAEPRWPPLVSPPTKAPLAIATATTTPTPTATPAPTPIPPPTQAKPIDDSGITREASTTMAVPRVVSAAPVVAAPSSATSSSALNQPSVPTTTPASSTLPADASPEALLAFAKAESDAGRTASALDALDKYRDTFPAGSDEAWYLYAQVLEANGPNKDIKSALSYYKRLMAEYPQSSRYDEARKRLAYLERYYFDIR